MNAPTAPSSPQDTNLISAKDMLARLKEAAGIAEQTADEEGDESEYGLSKNKTATLYRWDAQWWAMSAPPSTYQRGTRPDVPYIGPFDALALVNSGDLVFQEDRVNLRLKTLKDAYKREDVSPTKAARKAKAAKSAKVPKAPKAKKVAVDQSSDSNAIETKARRSSKMK